MTFLLLAPVALALLLVVAYPLVCRWVDRPLTPTDRRLGAIDRDLDERMRRQIGGWKW